MTIVGRHVKTREAVLISLIHINLGSGGSIILSLDPWILGSLEKGVGKPYHLRPQIWGKRHDQS